MPDYFPRALDYSNSVRGNYGRRIIGEGANMTVLEPDVANAGRSSAAVNEANRMRRDPSGIH